ncbi:ABC transporter substrate-binding protein [Roseovarius salinarum]|uniref:ABC transporter substrate-binding protein n=1 Tax=Roseovarius salinarum TaxID=1981892 RepID=UPI0012FFD5D8|nr:ABC transporter substrate-binding protein [Roseovarius salinarum]
MRKFCRALAIVCLAALLSIRPAAGRAEDPSLADWASDAVRALDALSAKADLAPDARMRRFRKLATRIFALDAMAAAALPRDVRPTPSDRARYGDAFRHHLAIGFERAVQRFGPTTSRVRAVRQRADTRIVLLRTQSEKRTRTSAWILCPPPALRVCDVEVDGIRMSAHHRREFAAVLAQEGLEGLIAHLRSGRLARP